MYAIYWHFVAIGPKQYEQITKHANLFTVSDIKRSDDLEMDQNLIAYQTPCIKTEDQDVGLVFSC